MAKKTIPVKQVLQDIKAGMHENALMNKYRLSPGQLKSVMAKLEQAGLIEPPEPPAADPAEESPLYGPFFSCPACGLNQPGEYDECPRCGVVVSKYNPPAETATTPDPSGKPKAKVEFGGWAQTTPKSHQGLRLLVAIVVLVLAVVLIVMVNRYKQAQEQAARQHLEQLSTTSDAGEEELTRGPHKFKDLIEKRLPRVKPINPEVDSLLRKSMGRIGDALDERDRARRDLTNQP